MSDILISGYYGFRNNGDDTILMTIIDEIRSKRPNADIVVLSKNPAETEKIYNVRSVSRENVFRIVREIKETKLLISGGGTLIQDGTSTKSLLYYLFIIKTAELFGKKVMLYANGIGPLGSHRNRVITKKILNGTDVITLRDKLSEEELSSIGVTKPRIYLTADPAFVLSDCDACDDEVLSENGIPTDKPLLLVSVRPWKEIGVDFCDAIARACDYAFEKYGLYPVLLPMQLSRDTELCEEVAAKMHLPCTVIKAENEVKRLLAIYRHTELCVGMRLHTLIYSAVACTSMIGLVYDPKVSEFLEYIGVDDRIDVSKVSFELLKQYIDKNMSTRADERARLLQRSGILKEKAKLNTELAIELLDGGDKR